MTQATTSKASAGADISSPARESFDLAMDLDLERALSPSSESSDTVVPLDDEKETAAGSTGADLAKMGVGALTLSADDPENPRLWSTKFKVAVNIALCLWVLSLTYASTSYVSLHERCRRRDSGC